MWLRTLVEYLRSIPRHGSQPAGRRPAGGSRRRSAGLRVESLDDRTLPSFSPAAAYAVGANPQAMVAADLNKDGRPDLATADYDAGTVSVLLGNPDGTFGTARTSATGASPRSLAVGDLDKDGNRDLVTANATGSVSVLLGNGDGTFNKQPDDIPVDWTALAVATGDFNGDGTLDLVVGSRTETTSPGYYGGTYTSYQGNVRVLIGNGAGGFSEKAWYALTTPTPGGIAVGDFNRDGRPDVVTANNDGGSVSVLLGNGDGTLRYNGWSSDSATGWYPRAVAVGDFTGDGIPDLVTAGQTVDVLPGVGDGTFVGVRRLYVDPVAVATADLNGDGKLDAVTADTSTGTVSALLGLGTGALTLPLDHAAGRWPTAVAVGDFNGDGRPDAAAAGGDGVSVLLNDGNWPALDAPSLRVDDVTVVEGNAGTTTATFTVTLSAASTRDVTVRYATGDGYSWSPATAGEDYQAVSERVTIRAGTTTATFVVPVIGDRVGENAEYFAVRLTEPANAFIADGQGLGTIHDDEPRITVDNYNYDAYGYPYAAAAAEGNTDATEVTFTVRLSAPSDQAVTVNFSTAEGDTDHWSGYWDYYGGYYPPPAAASSGTDFEARTGTVTFAPNETVQTVKVRVYGDRLAEPEESFSVNLSSPVGAGLDQGHAVGRIVDDEPVVSISGTRVTEGNTGTTAATFTVSLSAAYDEEVRVTYATADGYYYWYGAAAAGADYQAKTGTLVFPPTRPPRRRSPCSSTGTGWANRKSTSR